MKTIDRIILYSIALVLLLAFGLGAWDNDKPADTSVWNDAAGYIRDNWDALEVELGVDIAEAHPYYQSAAPSTKPDGSTALDVDDNGRIWVDSDDNAIYILTDYSGPTWTQAASLAIAPSAYTNKDSDNNTMLKSHAYKAATAGFVFAWDVGLDSGEFIYVYVDSTSDPAGVGDLIQISQSGSADTALSVCAFVAKDEYFEIVTYTTAQIKWKSFGLLSNPIDYD